MSERNVKAEENASFGNTNSEESRAVRSVKIAASDLTFQTSEAIKMLRANIQFSGYGLNTIAVTSCYANEGKSFVAFELARSLADLGERALLLDCDIRNSVLQSKLGVVERMPGLSDFLVGKAQIGDILCKTNQPHLHIIFAGSVSPNPAELLSEELFEHLCEALKKKYDYIIMDTAPLGLVIDAAIVAKQCDGTIFVIKAGNTERKQALQIKARLEAARIRILGVVLNEVEEKQDNYKHYGYYKTKKKKH